MPPVPQELIDAIVDEIDDRKALSPTCLAARTFVSPCQKRLFRGIHFVGYISSSSEYTRRAAELFASSPHLRSHVRTLAMYELPTAADFPILAQVLNMFRDLRIVQLNLTQVSWGMLSQDLSDALMGLMGCPSLQCLAMRYCTVPAALISFVHTSVVDLVLHEARVESLSPHSSLLIKQPSNCGKSTLKRLQLGQNVGSETLGSVSRNITPHLSKLQRLGFDIRSDADVSVLASVLDATEDLERLTLCHEPNVDSAPLDIRKLPSLRVLELRMLLGGSPKMTLAQVLSIVPRADQIPHVEKIHILLDSAAVVSVPLSADDPPGLFMGISSTKAFTCLTELEFELWFPLDEGYIADDGRSALTTYILKFWESVKSARAGMRLSVLDLVGDDD
ncbi:hypothetical protein FB45DRAFT_841928, partial [Roridomyces roridus]